MSCIGCRSWKWNGKKSVADLLYGQCSRLNEEKAHDETCDVYEEKLFKDQALREKP